MALFEHADLEHYLQVSGLDADTVTAVRRYASGWLMDATRVTPWPPDPVPDDIWAWAIELAAIALRNPAGAASQSIDDYSVSHDAERRLQILAAAERSYATGASPVYSFPEPDWHWESTSDATVSSLVD
jgi:hypothetical protein